MIAGGAATPQGREWLDGATPDLNLLNLYLRSKFCIDSTSIHMFPYSDGAGIYNRGTDKSGLYGAR